MRPGMTRKPGVLKCRQAFLPATECLGKRDDFETNALWIGKRKFVLAVIFEAIPFVGDTAEAPCTEPITFRSAQLRRGANLQSRLDNERQRLPIAGCDSGHKLHEKNLA